MSVQRGRALVLVSLLAGAAHAGEQAIRDNLKQFFESPDPALRTELAAAIKTDPVYDRARMSDWLHSAGLFQPLPPGRSQITSSGTPLTITLRIPTGYDPAQAWPLLYALHGTGGHGESAIRYLEQVLGDNIERYVIAAPSGYDQVEVNGATPYSTEHVDILRDIKRRVHIDSDRVFATGYSRGGHSSWTLAVLNSDQFAGIMPLAGTLVLPEYDKLFEVFLPNVRTPVLCCWGVGDTEGDSGPSKNRGIAGLNTLLRGVAEPLNLPITWVEDAECGHGGIVPPREALNQLLSSHRKPWPREFTHVFRVIEQGAAEWIEAGDFVVKPWDRSPTRVEFKPGEKDWDEATQREALARAVRGKLGEIRAEIEGQRLKLYRKNVKELTIWVGDDMIDWSRPVTLTVNGAKAYEGKLEPELLVCLTQAEQTRDFDRLRWAGLHFESGRKATVITAKPVPQKPRGSNSP